MLTTLPVPLAEAFQQTSAHQNLQASSYGQEWTSYLFVLGIQCHLAGEIDFLEVINYFVLNEGRKESFNLNGFVYELLAAVLETLE